ncbi:hypothetical protein BAR24066_03394 [Burkholderia arboris]|uniref:Uncharacterized protein n=1 Tax=Burkholderia arboris TaxID=488730 RepID=A0A9Q9SJ73_9BURK|nr:hypothetical protein BAR24066_03394 [Burkholderia arboris]
MTGIDLRRTRSRIGCARRSVRDQRHDGVRAGVRVGCGVRRGVLCDGIRAAARKGGCGQQGCTRAPSRRAERLFCLMHHGLPMRAMPRCRAAIYVWSRGPVKIRSPFRRPVASRPALDASRERGSARGPAVRIPICEIRAIGCLCPWRKAHVDARRRTQHRRGSFVSGMKRLSVAQRAGASAARCQRWNRIDAIQQTRNSATMP